MISSAELFHENSLIVACRFRIRHTKFKKKIMKTQFQRKYEWFWKIKVCVHNSPIIRPSFQTKIGLSSTGIFHENSLVVACWSFGRFEIRTPNGFKTQTNDTSKLLAHNCNDLQEFVKQKKLVSIIVVLSKSFLNTFIKIAILGKLYQYSSCYAKLEQHWTKYLCVHNSPTIQRDGEESFLFNKPLLMVGIAVK